MSNKQIRHVGKKEKARRKTQLAKKRAPKKRPIVQEPKPPEAGADPDDPNALGDVQPVLENLE